MVRLQFADPATHVRQGQIAVATAPLPSPISLLGGGLVPTGRETVVRFDHGTDKYKVHINQ
jgi:hypothetical protein